jgi:hypothetical protein
LPYIYIYIYRAVCCVGLVALSRAIIEPIVGEEEEEEGSRGSGTPSLQGVEDK